MTSGIYAYWDNIKNYYVYVGKDSNIDKKTRHNAHISKSKYDKQPINRVLQNNPERYEYRVIMESDYNEWQLNKMEKLCIKSFKTFKEDYPERNVFNFTKGGDGASGYRHTDKDKIKMSKLKKGITPWNKNKKTGSLTKKTKEKMSKKQRGKNNPRAKYTLWDINKIQYSKNDMLKCNGGNKPKKVFTLKYNGKKIYIGMFIDFTTPEIIHDLICETVEDYKG